MIVHIRLGFAFNSVKCFCHWYSECHVAISKMEIRRKANVSCLTPLSVSKVHLRHKCM